MRLPSGPEIPHHAQCVWLVPNSGHRGIGASCPTRSWSGDSAPASPSASLSPTERPANAANSKLSQSSYNVAVQVQGPALPPKQADDQQDPPPAPPSDLHSPTEGPYGADHSEFPVRSRAGAATAQEAPDSGSITREESGQTGTLPAELPAAVGGHDGQGANMVATLDPGSSMTSRTGADLQHILLCPSCLKPSM